MHEVALVGAGLVAGAISGGVLGFLAGRAEGSHARRLELLEAYQIFRRIAGELYAKRVGLLSRELEHDVAELSDRLAGMVRTDAHRWAK